jgi:hypothetical protein
MPEGTEKNCKKGSELSALIENKAWTSHRRSRGSNLSTFIDTDLKEIHNDIRINKACNSECEFLTEFNIF